MHSGTRYALGLLLYLLLFQARPATAQRPFLRHFSTKDGLPSDVIYDIFPDRKGFIWFCTDQGISRYDGTRFSNYNINDGLPDNEIFGMREDAAGRHWIICYNSRICYFKDGKIYTDANDLLCRWLEQANFSYSALFFYVACSHLQNKDLLSAIPKAAAQQRRLFPSGYPAALYATEYKGVQYLISNRAAFSANGRRARVQVLSAQNSTGCSGYGNRIYLAAGRYGTDSIHSYSIERDGIVANRTVALPAPCYQISCESESQVLCFTAQGAYEYDDAQGAFRKSDRYAGRVPVNRMVQDSEGNTWLGTLTDGAFVESNQKVRTYNNETGLPALHAVALCAQASGALIACFSNGTFTLMEQGAIRNFRLQHDGAVNRIKFAYQLADGGFLVGGDRGLYRIKARSDEYTMLAANTQKACYRSGHRYFTAHVDGAYCYDDSLGSLTDFQYKRATAVASGSDKTIWLGCLDGLYRWQAGTFSKFTLDSALSVGRIISLTYTAGEKLVIATHRSGVYIYDGKRLQNVCRRTGMASDNCTALCADADGTIWVATDKGLDKLTPSSGNRYSVYHYTELDGLPDGKINDITLQPDKLYVATSNGIVAMDKTLRAEKMQLRPRVYILGVILRDSTIDWPSGQLKLPYKNNSFQVNYTGVFLSGSAGLHYYYKLEGAGNDTFRIAGGMINLSNIKPGRYRLLIWATHDALPGNPSIPAVLDFLIPAPFWLTLWFAALCIAVALLILYFVYLLKMRSVRRKNQERMEQQQQIAVLKLQALRSQINPHFMFNALNSIQHYYIQGEDLKANQYMGLFSQLIRKSLNHSEQDWLSLNDELDMLRAYMDLERMRFKNTFSYEIRIDPAIDPGTTLIPSMLLQPYVENAIGHGLRPLQQGEGLLRLTLAMESSALTCTVEDNGIGIHAGRRAKAPGRVSFGMKLTQQRIETLNALYGTTIDVNVQDRSDLDPTLRGTLIIIYLPKRPPHE